MKILVTGAAGFIGMTTSLRLLARGDEVVGLDNLNDYYEVSLKENRLKRLTALPGFRFVKLDVGDRAGMEKLFADEKFDKVIHLAAQAGVRYLQCSLCECQWHVVRSKCSNCDSTHALDYWCLEDEKAPIKAESCNECQTYLKAFYQQADHQLELVADDLASLALDAEMEEKELARSGINPLMLPLLA